MSIDSDRANVQATDSTTMHSSASRPPGIARYSRVRSAPIPTAMPMASAAAAATKAVASSNRNPRDANTTAHEA